MSYHPIGEILRKAGYTLTDAGEYWRTAALYRGGTKPTSLSIHKRTGWFQDFAVQRAGPAEDLVALVSGQAAITSFSDYSPEPEPEKVEIVKVYPKEVLRRLVPNYGMFLERGISRETMKTFEAGLAHANKMSKRICFPIYDKHGRIIGFSGRWFYETPLGGVNKWKNIGKKKDWIFPNHLNADIIRKSGEIILVESIGDLLSLWEAGIRNTLCLFGLVLGPKRLSYIIGLDVKRIIISTNLDAKGWGQKAARKIERELRAHFDNCEILISHPPAKDFGIMKVPEVQSWYAPIRNTTS